MVARLRKIIFEENSSLDKSCLNRIILCCTPNLIKVLIKPVVTVNNAIAPYSSIERFFVRIGNEIKLATKANNFPKLYKLLCFSKFNDN